MQKLKKFTEPISQTATSSGLLKKQSAFRTMIFSLDIVALKDIIFHKTQDKYIFITV